MTNDVETDLTETERWFRDRLNDALQYGMSGVIVVIGWLLSADSVISLHHELDADKREAAMAVAIVVPILWLAWYLYLNHLKRRSPSHPTVPSWRTIHACAFIVAVVLAAIIFFVAFD